MNWFEQTRDFYGARWFAGMELAYPQRWRRFRGEAHSATLMKRTLTPDRVAVIISGGGSDGPLLPGFVGEGLADACVVGAPYSAQRRPLRGGPAPGRGRACSSFTTTLGIS